MEGGDITADRCNTVRLSECNVMIRAGARGPHQSQSQCCSRESLLCLSAIISYSWAERTRHKTITRTGNFYLHCHSFLCSLPD